MKLIVTSVIGGRILATRDPPVSQGWNGDVQLSVEIGDMEIASQIMSCASNLLGTYRLGRSGQLETWNRFPAILLTFVVLAPML